MKILLTTSFYPPYHVGGADTLVKYFAERLVKEGHEVHVLFSMDAFRFKRSFASKESDYKGVIVHALESPLGKLEPILNYSVSTQRNTREAFEALVREHDFDVVHHHNISLIGYNVLKRLGKYRSFYTAHDFWLVCPKFDLYKFGSICEAKTCLTCVPLHKKPYPIYQLLPDFKRTVEHDVDCVIAPSAYMKARIGREFRKRTEIIWNFTAPPPKKLDTPAEEDYFLFVGQLERHKGILPLIDAFKKRTETLVIFGTGSLEKKVIESIGDARNIIFKGWASSPAQILGYMKGAKALILPSLWAENNPIVALEALSVGTPIIGTANGGIPDIVSLYGTELLFDASEFTALGRILDGFDPKRYPRARLQAIWRRDFTWEAHRRRLKEVGYFG